MDSRLSELMVRDTDIRDKFRTVHPGIIGFLDYIYAECSDDEFESVIKDCYIKVRHISSFSISDYKRYDFEESYVRAENSYSERPRLHVSIEDVNGHMINLYTPLLTNGCINILRTGCLYLCIHSNAVICGTNRCKDTYYLKEECERIFDSYRCITKAFTGHVHLMIAEQYIRRFAFDVEKNMYLEVLREFIKCSYEYIDTILDICNENDMNELAMTILRIIEEEGLRVNTEPMRL